MAQKKKYNVQQVIEVVQSEYVDIAAISIEPPEGGSHTVRS